MAEDDHKVIQTAAACVLLRGKIGVPFGADIARVFSERYSDILEGFGAVVKSLGDAKPCDPDNNPNIITTYLEGRHILLLDTVNSLGNTGIAEFAAGMSPASLEMLAANPNRFYAETSQQPEIPIKRYIIETIKHDRELPNFPNHHLFPVDATKYDDVTKIGELFSRYKRDCNPTARLCGICEGFYVYPSAEDQDTIFENWRKLLEESSSDGCIATVDLAMRPEFFDAPGGDRIREGIKKEIKRDLTLYESDEAVYKAVREHGLATKGFMSVDGIADRLKTPEMFGLGLQKVQDFAYHYRPIILTLAR